MSVSLVRGTVLAAVVASAAAAAAYFAYANAKTDEQARPNDPVVAMVDGEKIHRSDLESLKEQMARQIPQLASVDLDAVYKGLLDRAIDQRLISREAGKAGLADSPDIKTQLRDMEDELVRRTWLTSAVDKKLTDERVKARYEELVKETPAEDEVRARHILVDDEGKAKQLIAKLRKGIKFEDLVKAESRNPGPSEDGDLGYFTRSGVVPEFAEAAFAMAKGDISKTPVKTQFGWHIIQIDDRRPVAAPAFNDVAEQIRSDLAAQTAGEVIADLRKSSSVETFNVDGSKPTD